jgi:hypothetical protein
MTPMATTLTRKALMNLVATMMERATIIPEKGTSMSSKIYNMITMMTMRMISLNNLNMEKTMSLLKRTTANMRESISSRRNCWEKKSRTKMMSLK